MGNRSCKGGLEIGKLRSASSADVVIWLSLADPQHTQRVIRGYVDSLGDEQVAQILRSSRPLVAQAESSDAATERGALLSVLTGNVRVLETLPKEERRRFLELCKASGEEQGMHLFDDASASTPAFGTHRNVAVAAIVSVLVLALIVGGVLQAVHSTGPMSDTFVAQPAPHVAVAVRKPSSVRHVRSHAARVVARAATVRAHVATVPSHVERAVSSVSLARTRFAPHLAPRVKHVAYSRGATAGPSDIVAPTPESVIAGLYTDANPSAAVLSVSIVRDTPESVVADVTSRQDDATIIDRLMLTPQGTSFDIVGSERLSPGSQGARACFVRGIWKAC